MSLNNYIFLRNLTLEKYYNEPEEQYNIISIAMFRLYENYKPMTKYYNQFNELVKMFKNYFPNYYLRVYFDDSIVKSSGIPIIDSEINELWTPLLTKLKEIDFVQLCKYTHHDFLHDKHKNIHRGTFGTIIRFLPLFDYDMNKNLKIVIIMDMDVSPRSFNTYIDLVKFSTKHNLKLMFRTQSCKYVNMRDFIVSDMTKTWLRMLAGTIICNNFKFPHNILDKFFGCIINDNKYHTCEYISKFSKYLEADVKDDKTAIMKKIDDNIFIYGIDEFLSIYMLNYLIEHNIKFGYILQKLINRSTYIHYARNNEYKDEIPAHKEMMKLFLDKYYDDNLSLKENFHVFDKYINPYNIFNKRPMKGTDHIIRNLFSFFNKVKQNNLYKYYGFKKEEVECILQEEKTFNRKSNEMMVFSNKDVRIIKYEP